VNAPALRPLGIGEILDVGIKIYWRNASTLFRIVLFVVLPAQILVTVIQVSALPPDVGRFGGPFGSSFGDSSGTLSGRDSVTLAVGFVVATIINALAGKLAQAGCFRAVADAYLGEEVGWRQSLRYGLRRLPAVVALSILSTIFIALGTIACVIPGIYLWGAFYVAIPVLLVEGVRPMRALGRSRQLVKGRWWGTFGVAIIGYLLVAIIGAAFTGLILGVAVSSARNTVTGFVVSIIATTLSSMLTTPAVAAFATVLYIDLRVRKEGFDLFLLAQRLGVEPRDADAGAASLLPPEVRMPEGEQPPFWPPPPGWQPSGRAPVDEPGPSAGPDEPPYWPPPPGWKPGGR